MEIPVLDPWHLIVLDFDGTLFPSRFFTTKEESDPVLVSAINKLCEHYDFRIILSATAKEQGLDKCKEYLRQAGVNPEYLHQEWCIPTVVLSSRWQNIEYWYNIHKSRIGSLLIFDDDYCSPNSPLRRYWYTCDSESGLPRYALVELYSNFNMIMEQNK